LAEELAEQAKELWDQNLLVQEIAEQLQCSRDMVTEAIGHWFRSRGLPVPDGRVRRKSLERKCSRPESPDLSEDRSAEQGAT
jgi:orotate phosphoribosyltransferase-like protein